MSSRLVRGFETLIALRGHGALVARGHEEIVPARALVGPGQSHVGHPAEVGVVDRTERPRRHPHDDRPVLQVDAHQDVDGGGVGRQEQRAGVHQLLGDADAAVGLDARFFQAATEGIHRRGRHALDERVDAASEVDLVVGELDRRRIGRAVLEAQRADAGLDRVGRRDLGGHVGRVLRRSAGRAAGACASLGWSRHRDHPGQRNTEDGDTKSHPRTSP